MSQVLNAERRTFIPDLIGRTPLVRLRLFEESLPDIELYARVEWRNPGGTVKDRAAARMVREAEHRGDLRSGKVLLDATSGNTGVAIAMIGAARGYPVKLCVPRTVGCGEAV